MIVFILLNKTQIQKKKKTFLFFKTTEVNAASKLAADAIKVLIVGT